mgnify:CR=1 FL=1
MAAKSRNCQEDKQKEEKERRLAIKLLYLDKEYTVRFSSKADTKTICQAVKKKTGVKGTFYLHGEGIRGYLHSSSLTAANLKKFGGKPVELRGGGCKYFLEEMRIFQ